MRLEVVTVSDDDALESVDGADGGLRAAAAVSQLRGEGPLRPRPGAVSPSGMLGGEERFRREGHQSGLERRPQGTHER